MSISSVSPPIVVLKFGSSVLHTGADLPSVVSEIYCHVRQGEHVIAVVSAFAGVTDRIFLEARRWTTEPDPHALATAVATGEMESATQLVFALQRAGVPATFLDPRDANFRTCGDRLNAEPLSIDALRLRQIVEKCPVTIVPGFYGLAESHGIALFGRGGSDLTAVYLAHRLSARCVLLKDVGELCEFDPLLGVTQPRRFVTATYKDTLTVGGKLIQSKAIQAAEAAGQHLEIRAIGGEAGTVIGPELSKLVPSQPPRLLRVVLLGLGTVGRGVYESLAAQPKRYQIIAILVRDPDRHAEAGVPQKLLVANPAEALRRARYEHADVMIEAMGGLEPAYSLTLGALKDDVSVITANKELIATHWEEFVQYLSGKNPKLRYSAAVGGAVPMVELVQRLVESGREIQELRGVVNGTCNFILDRLAAGVPFETAVCEAQGKGYAEPDPSADLNGLDAARKIEILCRLAFGAPPIRTDIIGLRAAEAVVPSVASPTTVCRLIASVSADRIACVAPVRLGDNDYLAQARGVENRLEVSTTDGVTHRLSGLGAGRYPTATAILADLLDVGVARSRATPGPARRVSPRHRTPAPRSS